MRKKDIISCWRKSEDPLDKSFSGSSGGGGLRRRRALASSGGGGLGRRDRYETFTDVVCGQFPFLLKTYIFIIMNIHYIGNQRIITTGNGSIYLWINKDSFRKYFFRYRVFFRTHLSPSCRSKRPYICIRVCVWIPVRGHQIQQVGSETNENPRRLNTLFGGGLKGEFTFFFYSRNGCPPIRGVKLDGS